ncbi:U-scoloptoxin(16)-Sm1a [Anabrus simplex]|uniref:U-scoloptoxin(16)-Sm1a n=1 Tax=Anabrus simplex TaxID=316456 RepID=UPI0035A31EBD
METFMVLLTATLLFRSVAAVLREEIVPPHPKYPHHCYDAKTDEAHPVSSMWFRPGECAQFFCDTYQPYYMIVSYGCPDPPSAHPSCKIVNDPSVPFPDCCPQVEC